MTSEWKCRIRSLWGKSDSRFARRSVLPPAFTALICWGAAIKLLPLWSSDEPTASIGATNEKYQDLANFFKDKKDNPLVEQSVSWRAMHGGSLEMFVPEDAIEKADFIDRENFVKSIGGAWCNGKGVGLPDHFVFPEVEFRERQSGDDWATYSCALRLAILKPLDIGSLAAATQAKEITNSAGNTP
jgi:hypothetical protein